MGLMHDSNDETLAEGAKPLTWVELTARLLNTKADEE